MIYESQKSVGVTASGTSVGTDSFSLLLVGGKSYDFGIVDATSTTTSSFSPAATLTPNWLSLDGGFSVCDGYTNPSFSYRISYISRALRRWRALPYNCSENYGARATKCCAGAVVSLRESPFTIAN